MGSEPGSPSRARHHVCAGDGGDALEQSVRLGARRDGRPDDVPHARRLNLPAEPLPKAAGPGAGESERNRW